MTSRWTRRILHRALRRTARNLMGPGCHQMRIRRFLRHSRHNDFVAEPQPC